MFYTDGGVCSDEFYYGMHQLFGNGKYLYSSKYLNEKELQKGVILQAYIGRKASHGQLVISEMRKNPYEPMVLQLPIDRYVHDKNEVETFKQITSLTINRLNIHYTCLCKSFVLFINDKEINCAKSNALKLF